MLQNPQQQTQKQAEKTKSCMKILNGKKTKHRVLNEFNFHLNREKMSENSSNYLFYKI